MNPVTVSLCVLSLGRNEPDVFAQYVEGWFRAVEGMNPKPDEICIGYFEPDTAGVTEYAKFGVSIPVTLVPVSSELPIADVINATVEATSSDWFSWIGLDDIALPEAFVDLQAAEDSGAELLGGVCLFSDGGQWKEQWNPGALLTRTTIPGNSPIRKSVWERVGGYDEVYFHDWAFWLKLANAGVKVAHTSKPGMIFHSGENHETRSGKNMIDRQKHMADFRHYAAKMGFGA